MIPDVICKWIGDGEGCKNHSLLYKSYCGRHHSRMYIGLLPEMADYIIEKELNPIVTKSHILYNSNNKGNI